MLFRLSHDCNKNCEERHSGTSVMEEIQQQTPQIATITSGILGVK